MRELNGEREKEKKMGGGVEKEGRQTKKLMPAVTSSCFSNKDGQRFHKQAWPTEKVREANRRQPKVNATDVIGQP